jgi:hypothetical protein
LVATTASAEPFTNPNTRTLSSNIELTATPVGAGQPRVADFPLYSNMTMTGSLYFVSFQGGAVSADDYNSGLGAGTATMDHFQFIGGVAAPGQVLFFTFFDTAGSYVSSFGVQLPYGGAYIWTITGAGGGSMNRPVGNAGFVQQWADDGSVVTLSTAIWYLNSDAPTVGTTGPTFPGLTAGGVPLDHKFSILVPEPGSLALLGMGVMTLVVRRRR